MLPFLGRRRRSRAREAARRDFDAPNVQPHPVDLDIPVQDSGLLSAPFSGQGGNAQAAEQTELVQLFEREAVRTGHAGPGRNDRSRREQSRGGAWRSATEGIDRSLNSGGTRGRIDRPTRRSLTHHWLTPIPPPAQETRPLVGVENEEYDLAVGGLFNPDDNDEILASLLALLLSRRPEPGPAQGDMSLAASFPVFPSPAGPVAGSSVCPICLEMLDGQLLLLPCLCVGHEYCMARALDADVRCPLHRIDVRSHLRDGFLG
jgi:hypothetical protein